MPSSQYNVNIFIKAKDQTSKPAGNAKNSLETLKKAAKLAGTAFVALKTAQKALEFVKWGAKIDRAAKSLNTLAAAAGQSGEEIIKSIRVASDFQVDRMGAMEAANKALLLEVVKTPEEFAEMTRNAVLLGRAMGEDAATSIDKFTRAAGRQSKLIADDLGLKIDLVKVQEETNRLMAEDATLTEDAAKAQGFFNVMMEEATRKSAALGEQVATTADKIDTVGAAAKTAGQVFGEQFADSIGTALVGTKDFAEVLSNAEPGIRAAAKTVAALFDPSQTADAVRAWQEAGKASFNLGAGIDDTGRIIQNYNGYVADGAESTLKVAKATREWDTSTEDLFTDMANAPRVVTGYGDSVEWLTERLEEQRAETERLANATKTFAMESAADFTSFAKLQARDAKDLAEDKEAIEQEHQDKLAEIQAKGRSTAVRLDATAEQAKLVELQRKLDQAILKRSEVTDKTKQSTLNAKDHAVTTLTEQVGAQEALLANYHAGRLVNAGQNIDGLLAAEATRYDEEKRLLDESRIEQEIAQKESLGRMVLTNFIAWGEINNVSADKMFAIQLSIQEKYGLIDEAGAEMGRNTVAHFKTMVDLSIGQIDALNTRIASIPRTIDIDINFQQRQAGKEAAIEEFGFAVPGMDTGMASGGTAPGGPVMVGELGPEMVSLPRGSRVSSHAETNNTVGSNNTYNINGGQAAAAMMARERMERGAAFARGTGM